MNEPFMEADNAEGFFHFMVSVFRKREDSIVEPGGFKLPAGNGIDDAGGYFRGTIGLGIIVYQYFLACFFEEPAEHCTGNALTYNDVIVMHVLQK
jgi:hypothetical protein